jgi:protein-tyrosine phosphatase
MSAGQEITPEMMKMFAALTKVHAEYLEAFFDEVDTRWGGTEGYLKNALGLTDAELEKMKDLYLEQM